MVQPQSTKPHEVKLLLPSFATVLQDSGVECEPSIRGHGSRTRFSGGSFMFCGRFGTFKTSTATSDAIDSFAPCGLASPQSLQKLQNKELAGSEVTWQGQLSCSPCTTSSSGDRCLLADTAPVYVYVLSQHPQRLDDAGNSHSATCLQKARAMLETCCGPKMQDLVWLGQGRKSRGEVQFAYRSKTSTSTLLGSSSLFVLLIAFNHNSHSTE